MLQPLIIQDSITIAANDVNTNVIASNASLKPMQRLPFPAKIEVAFVQSAEGLEMNMDVGASNIISSSNGRVSSGAPEIPFDVVNQNAYGAEGDTLVLKAANTTAGAIELRYIIIATPMAPSGTRVQLPPNTVVIQQGPISIADGTVDQQLLDGLRYERAPVESMLDILMTSSAAGLTRQAYVDQTRVAPPSTISLANRVPQDPTDMTVGGIHVPEDKEIQLEITNQSGGALDVFWKMLLHQLVRQ